MSEINIIPDANNIDRAMLDPIGEAKKQHAMYLVKMLNITLDDATARVDAALDRVGIVDPSVEHYHRGENGDREIRTVPLTKYIALSNDKIMAPTFTQYYTEEQKPAMLVGYTSNNLAMRGKTKKLMFKAFADDRIADGIRLDYTQANWKAKSNDITGLFLSMGSSLYNPSCHPTLTSLSRLVTSIHNTASERILQGRRHYHTYDIVINNLNSIVTNLGDRTNLDSYYSKWVNAIAKYDIVVPTVTQCFKSIMRSVKLYWYNPAESNKILAYIKTMDDVERCAIIYTGDFYTLRVHNPELVRNYLSSFIEKKTGPIEYTREELKGVNDELLNYVHHRFASDIVDLGVDYADYSDQLVSDMCRTAYSAQNAIAEYLDLILAVFVNPNLPPVIYDIYDMMRDSVLMSDTDSGANTLQEWVMWYYGKMTLDENTLALANALVYLKAVVVKVYIKYAGRNINMSENRLDSNIMELKNEFTWLVFGLMSISKHYFSGVNVREGSVFARKLEVKGGSLKSNSIPMSVKQDVVYDKLMNYILDSVEKTGKVSFYTAVDYIIELEQSIIANIEKGDSKYIRKLTINENTAYKITDPKKNAFQHCVFWNDVFSQSTGFTAVAPYLTYKYPTTLKNKTALVTWLTNIEDETIRKAMGKWLMDHGKTKITIFYLPAEYVISYGVPDIIKPVIDTKKIILDLCNMAYITLESLAYYKPLGLTLSEIFHTRVRKHIG